jgi:glycosyltransferase involved in cell wall biosynthesis
LAKDSGATLAAIVRDATVAKIMQRSGKHEIGKQVPRSNMSGHIPSRVAYLITGLAHGGAETQLVQLALRMQMRGWKVRVITLIPPQAYTEQLHNAGVRVDTLGMTRKVPDPRALFRLARMLRREPPHILHAHMFHANLLARLARLITSVCVLICTAHSTYESPDGASDLKEITWREWAYRLTDSLCDLTTQISQTGLERYVWVKAVPQHKICVVPNGVDINRFRPDARARFEVRSELKLHDDCFVWLAVGRFDYAKDYSNLLHAFAQLSHEDAFLLIAGQGPLKSRMESLAHQLGIAQKVLFLGIRQDVPRLMNAADGYVMSSFYEGLPMVLLEASASGLPIVATDVGGNRELVLNGQTGYLVSPRDAEALSAAMRRLMNMPVESRNQLGVRGRERVLALYSLDRVVDQWEQLYVNLYRQTKCPSC